MKEAGRTGYWEATITAAWQRRGWLACLLWPLSCLFGLVAAARRAGFRLGWLSAVRLPVPVVVVGNVTVGGAGKTPTVIALIEALRAQGLSPGVVSRGYRSRASASGKPVVVLPDSGPDIGPDVATAGARASGIDAPGRAHVADAAEIGDEPALIVQRTGVPLAISRDRVAAAQALLAQAPHVDVIISDDGLQHYRLARDVEIVVFDARLGGNGFLLPAGPLREPLRRRRDATLINGAAVDIVPPGWSRAAGLVTAMQLVPEKAWQVCPSENAPGSATAEASNTLQATVGQRRPLADFAHRDAASTLAAAGIGAPERFFSMLRAHGIAARTVALPDHHRFAHNPFVDDHAETILVTEKDAVKCGDWRDPRVWAVPVRGELDPRLIALVVEKVRGRSSA